jgi:uncharacterized membrane protein YebE (DUF533 family)
MGEYTADRVGAMPNPAKKSDAEVRAANEERVRIAKALVKAAKADGQGLESMKYAARLADREDVVPHLEEAWRLFDTPETSDE